jgi:uncharacterized membrane protein
MLFLRNKYKLAFRSMDRFCGLLIILCRKSAWPMLENLIFGVILYARLVAFRISMVSEWKYRYYRSNPIVCEKVLRKLQFCMILLQLIISMALAQKKTAAFRMPVASELPL